MNFFREIREVDRFIIDTLGLGVVPGREEGDLEGLRRFAVDAYLGVAPVGPGHARHLFLVQIHAAEVADAPVNDGDLSMASIVGKMDGAQRVVAKVGDKLDAVACKSAMYSSLNIDLLLAS